MKDTLIAAATAPLPEFLRDYQTEGIRDALRFIAEHLGHGGRRMYTAPTGSGKGTWMLEAARVIRDLGLSVVLLAPSLEIMQGNLDRLGVDYTPSTVAARALELGFATPVSAMNRLAAGEWEAPDVILWDEAHGAADNATADLFGALAPSAVWLGFTATPFRATARSTRALREVWGEPVVMLTLEDAVARGYVVMPRFRIAALVDDDGVPVSGGELATSGVTAAYQSELKRLTDIVVSRYLDGRRVVVAAGGTALARMLADEVADTGIPYALITAETSRTDRQAAYDAALNERAVLIQVRVLSQGFDMPQLDCLVDAQPTLSPNLWMQTMGRIMRPARDKATPEVICTNRNPERWAFLLEGLMPSEAIAESQAAFGGPTTRDGLSRTIGFEGLGRFKRFEVPLVSGAQLVCYSLVSQVEPGRFRELFVASCPDGRVLCASRVTGKGHWGKWAEAPAPEQLIGFSTSRQRGGLSDKQRAWWAKSARSRGLDPTVADTLSGRVFAAMPVAFDCRWHYEKPQTPAAREAAVEDRPAPPALQSTLAAFGAALDLLGD